MRKIFVNFLFVFLFCIPNSVLASSSLVMNCGDNNIAGQDLTCSMKIVLEEGVTYNKIESNINLSGANVTFDLENGFSGDINNDTLTINSNGENGNSNIGDIHIKFPVTTTGNKIVSLTNIKLYKDSTLVSNLSNASDSIKVKSDVKTLESLSLDECNGCNLSPNFNSNLTIYTVTTTSDIITFNAKASGNATIDGIGKKELTKEKETFEIVVTSEAGNTKKYKITVIKEELLSSDNSLKSITIDSGTLEADLSSNASSYTATVDKEEIVISAETNDSKATINGTGKKRLAYGKNEFTVIVTAENGNSKSYLITINRPDTRNANAYLKEISINGEKLNFEKDIVEYKYVVGHSIKELDIEALAELDTSTVTITGDKDLIVGENEIIITVVAEDESEKEYKIIVTRDEIDRSELYLESLTIKGYDIDFSNKKFNYDIVITEEEKLEIEAIPEIDDYNIEIIGNSDLKDGSIIKIIVTDSEGNTNIYKINVSIPNDNGMLDDNTIKDDVNYIPIIMTSLLVLLLILNIIQIIKRVRLLKK